MAAPELNIGALRAVSDKLDLLGLEYAFLGGAIVNLLLDDPGFAPARPTDDLDVVIQLVTSERYSVVEERLRSLGFNHDMREGAPRCRWVFGDLAVDIMPVDGAHLGLDTQWFPEALASATEREFAHTKLRLISPVAFIATKLAAFAGRGKGDYWRSHDLEDLIAVIDGRDKIVAEVLTAPKALHKYVADTLWDLTSIPEFGEALAGHLPSDSASRQRLPGLRNKIGAIASGTVDRFDPSISPIYEENSSGLFHRGTCLLIKSTSRFWVLTASHVAVDAVGDDHRIAPLWLPGKPKFQPIDVEKIHYCPKGIDVAFFEISAEKATIVAAGEAAFLPITALAPLATVDGRALVTGYPEKAVEIDRGELSVDVRQFRMRSPFLTEEEMARANLNPKIHVAVHAKELHDDATKQKAGKIDFHGLSGGTIQRDGERSAPIAIITDYDPKRQIIIGTRLFWLIRQMLIKLEAETTTE